MKSIQFIVCFLSLICFNSQLSAQLSNEKSSDIKEILQRPLIVIIEEPDPKIIKKFNKKGLEADAKDYIEDIKQYNANMKEMVEKYWKGNNKKILYKTFEAVRKLKSEQNTKYALLYCLPFLPSTQTISYYPLESMNQVVHLKEVYENENLTRIITHMIIKKIEDLYKKPIYMVPLVDVLPTKSSIKVGIHEIDTYFNYGIRKIEDKEIKQQKEEVAKNAPRLKDMTLLIRKDFLEEGTTKEALKAVYPYSFKLHSFNEYEKLVLQDDEKYAYLVTQSVLVASRSAIVVHKIYATKDNTLLGIITPDVGRGKVILGNMFLGGTTSGSYVNEEIMKKFAEQISGEEEDKDKKQKK
jgi:hypothetical protein